MLVLISSYIGFCVYSGFLGFAFGWFGAVLFETLMDLVGAERFSSAVGVGDRCGVLPYPPGATSFRYSMSPISMVLLT